MDLIKVAAKSRPTAIAGAVAGLVREDGRAEVQAIGVDAVHQAVKGIVHARGYLALEGIDVICIPFVVELAIDGKEITAIRLVVEPR